MIQGILPNEISLLDVQMWIDGISLEDRKTKSLPTRTDITVGSKIYSGNALTFNGSSSKIEVGDIGEIKTIMMFVKPTGTSEYFIDLDGSASVSMLNNIVTATGWTSPTIYVNRLATTAIKSGVWSLVTVTSDTAIDANAVVLGLIGSDYLEGSMTQVIALNKSITSTQVGQLYNHLEKGSIWNLYAEDYPSNLTFIKYFEDLSTGMHAEDDLDAEFSVGSGSATFTATRSATNPATYVDDNGIIQLTTDSDLARIRGGYYDDTGFHAQKGLMIEGSGTNLIIRTDGTASGSGLWTGWTVGNDGTAPVGTVVTSNTSIPELSGITSSKSQRITYTGVLGDANALPILYSTSSAASSVLNTNVVSVSCWIRSLTGNSGVVIKLGFKSRNAADAALTTYKSSDLASSISTSWRKFTFTATVTDATSDRARFFIFLSSVAEGDTFDVEIACPQLEISPYATSFIPTTTAALTRNAETLKYAISGNRTAASESIFMVVSPMWTTASGSSGTLLDSDTKQRYFVQLSGNDVRFRPNATDSSNCQAPTGATARFFTANTKATYTAVCSHTSPYASVYKNSSVFGTSETTDDFTNPAWGTYFYLGSGNAGTTQINGIIQSVAFYSDAKDATAVSQITNILNQ